MLSAAAATAQAATPCCRHCCHCLIRVSSGGAGMEACSGGSSSSSSGGGSSSSSSSALGALLLLLVVVILLLLTRPPHLHRPSPFSCQLIVLQSAAHPSSTLVNGWLLFRRPQTPPTTLTKATDDRHTCHCRSSRSSSSSSLVASRQHDDRPCSGCRTMTTVIAATMVTDCPPNRTSLSHSASLLSHPPLLLALATSVRFPYAAAVVRHCTVITHLAPVVLIVGVADVVAG